MQSPTDPSWEQRFLSAAAASGLLDAGQLSWLQTLVGTGRLSPQLDQFTRSWPSAARQALSALLHQAQVGTASGRIAAQGAGWSSTANGSRLAGSGAAALHTSEDPDRIGPYVIEEQIAKGGMGVVLRARHGQLGHTVAIKVLTQGAEASPASLRRFAIEGRAAAQLRHPNVAAVHELGESRRGPYLVMDYSEGGTLGDLLRAEGQLAPRRAVEIVRGAANGLAYAHRHGILHRDIKPDNILIDKDGTPRVTDFGLARELESAGDGSKRLTRVGALLGTPAYMSPEQAAGEQDLVDRRSDVYGLGVVLYELLGGRVPFEQDRLPELLAAIISADAPRLSKLAPDVDADLERIVATCMSKDPKERYPHARALADDLERWSNSEPISVGAPGLLDRGRKWIRRNPALAKTLIASVGVSLLIVLGSSGAFLSGVQRERDRALEAEATARKEQDAAEQARAAEAESRAGLAKALDTAETQLQRAERLLGDNFELIANQAVREQDWRTALEFGSRALLRKDTVERRLNVARAQSLAWRVTELERHPPVLNPNNPFDGRLPVFGWSPDGRWIALHDPPAGTLRVYTETGRRALLLTRARKGEDDVVGFAWSPDGASLAWVDRSRRVRVYDLVEGRVRREWRLERKALPIGMAWSRDDLVILCSAYLARFDPKTGKRTVEVMIPPPGSQKKALYRGPFLSHDGRAAVIATGIRLAGKDLKTVRHIVDVSARERAKELGEGGSAGWVRHAAWSRDGAWLLGDAGSQLLIWNRPGAAYVVPLASDNLPPLARWDSTASTLAAAQDATLFFLRPPARKAFQKAIVPDEINAITWAEGASRLAVQGRRQISLWRPPFRRPWRTISARTEFQGTPAWSAKEHGLFAALTPSGVLVWHRLEGVRTRVPLAEASPLHAAWHPTKPVLAVLGTTRMFLIRPPRRQRPHVGSLPTPAASRPKLVAWSSNGELLATARPVDAATRSKAWALTCWRPRTGEHLWNAKISEPIKQIAWADGQLLVKRATSLRWWSPGGKRSRLIKAASPMRLVPNPRGDGILLAPTEFNPGKTTIVLRPNRGSVTLAAPAGRIWSSATWSPDGDVIGIGGRAQENPGGVARSGRGLVVWRSAVKGGLPRELYRADQGALGFTLALSPKGDVLALVRMQTGKRDRVLFLIDPATRRLIKRIALLPGPRSVRWLTADHVSVFGSAQVDVFDRTGRPVRSIPVPRAERWYLGPKQELLCFVGGGRVELWTHTGERVFVQEKTNVLHASWSPRGDQIAAWGGQGTLLELIRSAPPEGTPAQLRAEARQFLSTKPSD